MEKTKILFFRIVEETRGWCCNKYRTFYADAIWAARASNSYVYKAAHTSTKILWKREWRRISTRKSTKTYQLKHLKLFVKSREQQPFFEFVWIKNGRPYGPFVLQKLIESFFARRDSIDFAKWDLYGRRKFCFWRVICPRWGYQGIMSCCWCWCKIGCIWWLWCAWVGMCSWCSTTDYTISRLHSAPYQDRRCLTLSCSTFSFSS